TMDLAIGNAALRAARRLLLGARRVELAIDLAEIVPPLRRAALRRHGLARRHELQQPLRHSRHPRARAASGGRPVMLLLRGALFEHKRRLGQYVLPNLVM